VARSASTPRLRTAARTSTERCRRLGATRHSRPPLAENRAEIKHLPSKIAYFLSIFSDTLILRAKNLKNLDGECHSVAILWLPHLRGIDIPTKISALFAPGSTALSSGPSDRSRGLFFVWAMIMHTTTQTISDPRATGGAHGAVCQSLRPGPSPAAAPGRATPHTRRPMRKPPRPSNTGRPSACTSSRTATFGPSGAGNFCTTGPPSPASRPRRTKRSEHRDRGRRASLSHQSATPINKGR
jgi:hypothetical protein